MDKVELCSICGNHHIGSCSSELTYFHWTPKEGQSIPAIVELVGEWYMWQSHQIMTREVDEHGEVYFQLGVSLPVGRYQYKYLVDGQWMYSDEVPTVKDPYGSLNNVVEVLPKKALMEYIPSQDIKITSSIAARELRIVGSWDNWKSQRKMELAYNNLKGCEQNFIYLELVPNTTYQFKFKLGKQFLIDQKYPTVVNEFGTQNNRIYIYSERMSTPTGWRTSKIISNTPITCRSFQWEKTIIDEDFTQYDQSVDGHSMCQIGEYIYIFGGRTRDDFTNKLTKVNIHKLSQMQAEENMPNQRAFHSVGSYGRKMIIYGGHNKTILQDYYAFDTTDNVWMPTAELQGDFPSKRQKQSCVLYEMLMVFFGGYFCTADLQFQYTFNDIQVLDLEHMRWINDIKVQGVLPPSRYSHAATLYHSQMYIFGGITINNSPNTINHYTNFNDLWMLNLQKVSALQWEQIQPKGKPPIPRHGHSINTLQDFLVIFGGKGDKRKSFNDVIVFDIAKRQWVYPLVRSNTSFCEPSPRVFHGATTVNNQYIVIFGGKTQNKVNQSIYTLRPKESKPTLDIEEEDEDDESESNRQRIVYSPGKESKDGPKAKFMQNLMSISPSNNP